MKKYKNYWLAFVLLLVPFMSFFAGFILGSNGIIKREKENKMPVAPTAFMESISKPGMIFEDKGVIWVMDARYEWRELKEKNK